MAFPSPHEYDFAVSMADIIRFPKRPAGSPTGPRPVYVCAPSYEDMKAPKKKFGLGYSREAARVAFYGGDPQSQHIEARTYTLKSAPGTLKFQIVNQLELFALMDHPLSAVEQDARERLGDNPYRYSVKGPRLPKRRRLDKLFG